MPRYNAARWLIDRHVESGAAERTAYRFDSRSVSYAELQRETWRAQNALSQLDVAPGARVAIIVDDELAFPVWFLGSVRSGVLPVPVPTVASAAAMAAAVAGVQAEVLVMSAPYTINLGAIAERAQTLRAVVVVGEPSLHTEGPSLSVHGWSEFTDYSEAAVALTAAEGIAFLLYTAGTTGPAKTVAHRHASPQSVAESYGKQVLGATAADRFLSVPRLFTAFGLGNSLLMPLGVGGCAVIDRHRPSPAQVLDLAWVTQPTLLFATPRFVTALLEAFPPRSALASVRCAVTAGEPLPAGLFERYRRRFGHGVVDGLCSAETLHVMMSNRPGAERQDSCGSPVPGWEIRLADEGRLNVRGPSLTAGYWKNGTVDPVTTKDGWLTTSDVVRRAPDGSWIFLGRSDDMISAAGVLVAPAEVESALAEHPDVLEVAVVADRDSEHLGSPVAFVVPRPGHRVHPDALTLYSRSRLPAAACPRRIEVVRELRWTATGSVRRTALRELLGAGPVQAESLTGQEEFPTDPQASVAVLASDG